MKRLSSIALDVAHTICDAVDQASHRVLSDQDLLIAHKRIMQAHRLLERAHMCLGAEKRRRSL